MTNQNILQQITTAATGLWYPSERDAPFLPYVYPYAGEPTPEALLEAEGLDPDTPIEELTLRELFEGLTEVGQSASPSDIAEAAAWRALEEAIEHDLADVRVYWVGDVDIDVYVIGRAPSGAWLGLRTTAVET